MKAHIAVGSKTQVICAAEITTKKTGDSPMFKPLFQIYSKYFEFKELSADKVYSSKANVCMAVESGIRPYIPFRSNTNPESHTNPQPEVWKKMYKYFKEHELVFMQHYHERSKVETAFSMVKKRLGPSIRAKDNTAQKNELLCKFLVHNITVLIQEMFGGSVFPIH